MTFQHLIIIPCFNKAHGVYLFLGLDFKHLTTIATSSMQLLKAFFLDKKVKWANICCFVVEWKWSFSSIPSFHCASCDVGCHPIRNFNTPIKVLWFIIYKKRTSCFSWSICTTTRWALTRSNAVCCYNERSFRQVPISRYLDITSPERCRIGDVYRVGVKCHG